MMGVPIGFDLSWNDLLSLKSDSRKLGFLFRSSYLLCLFKLIGQLLAFLTIQEVSYMISKIHLWKGLPNIYLLVIWNAIQEQVLKSTVFALSLLKEIPQWERYIIMKLTEKSFQKLHLNERRDLQTFYKTPCTIKSTDSLILMTSFPNPIIINFSTIKICSTDSIFEYS